METTIQFIDPVFDHYKVQNYELSLQISLRGFSFCVFDKNLNRFIAFKSHYIQEKPSDFSFRKEAKKWFTSDELLTYPYQKVKLVWIGKEIISIPHPFYHDNLAKLYGNLTLGYDENYIPYHFQMDEPNIDFLFNVHKQVAEMASAVLNNALIIPHSVPIIDNIISLTNKKNKPIGTINVHHDFFDVTIASAGNLKYFNTFQWHDFSDIIYYIMSVPNKQVINDQFADFLLYCPHSYSGQIYNLLKPYIPNLILQKELKQVDFRFPLQPANAVEYLPMFLSVKCV